MIIDCISDLHGEFPKLEGGDLLIVAGDLSCYSCENTVALFDYWLNEQKYTKKVFIGGNHDKYLYECQKKCDLPLTNGFQFGDYLCDSSTEFEGLKIWGSPWTPTFFNWYFMVNRGFDAIEKWDLIPRDVDILITHGPPYGILDKTIRGEKVGCMDLMNTIPTLKKLKLHVFGHIHEGYGSLEIGQTQFVNCSLMDENYEFVNKPIRIIL